MNIAKSAHALPAANSWRSHIYATLALGIPLIGAQLAQVGIHTTDMIIIGRLGAEKLAALVLAMQFYHTVFMLGSGFTIAVMPMVAQAYGQQDTVQVRRAMRMGMWAAIGWWLLTLPVFLNAKAIFLALGQNPDVAELSARYLAVLQFGMLPALLFNVARALVSAIGKAGIVLYVMLAMLILNGVLAYIVVLGHFGLPAFGMQGAAFVAVVVQVGSALFIFGYLQLRADTRRYELFVRFWKPDWQALGDVLRLGLPIGITILAEVSLFTAASLLMGRIGTMELAAHGIALQVASTSFMIPLGLAQAATVRVGVAYGQGDFPNLVRASITVYVIACIIAVIAALFFFAAPGFLAELFLDKTLPEADRVLSFASSLILIAAIFQIVDSCQAVASGLLRGLKDARVPMIMALFSYWAVGFVLAWALTFPLGVGGHGVWYGFVIGLGLASVLLTARFYMLVMRAMPRAA